MDQTIRESLQNLKGPLRVDGWKAWKIDDQRYLVGYAYDTGPGTQKQGWWFEVNLEANVIRDITADDVLVKSYADVKFEPTSK